MLSRNEVIDMISNNHDLISRVRVVLGSICIEAKSAQEVVSIDNALVSVSESLSKILSEYPPENTDTAE